MPSKPAAKKQDAISLLTEDHKKVQKLFKDFEKIKEDGDDEEKGDIVEMACAELTVHALLEEEIFYPAVRDAIDDQDIMDEAEVEHESAKELIAKLESMEPGDDLYDATFTVLGEYVNHHIEEEQGEMFAQAKKAKIDLEALGEEILARKQALMAEMGLIDEEDEEEEAPSKTAAKKQS